MSVETHLDPCVGRNGNIRRYGAKKNVFLFKKKSDSLTFTIGKPTEADTNGEIEPSDWMMGAHTHTQSAKRDWRRRWKRSLLFPYYTTIKPERGTGLTGWVRALPPHLPASRRRHSKESNCLLRTDDGWPWRALFGRV